MLSADEVLQEAVQHCQAGEKKQAARILVSLLMNAPSNEQGWWLLAACVDSPHMQRDCLERVLRINPDHLGARMFISRLDQNQPLPDLISALNPNMSRDITEEEGSGQTAAFQSHLQSLPQDPQLDALMDQAIKSETNKDFVKAYELYQSILELDSSHVLAWLGKGYAAGRLSNQEQNRITEFFDCFTRAVLSHDQLGLSLQEAAARLDPGVAQEASTRLLQLAKYTAQLALTTPQPIANVYAVERVHLTDWAYALGRRLNTQAGLWCSRAELIGVAQDAFQRIIQNVLETHPSTRARQEILATLKFYILSNLSISGVNKDPELLRDLDEMIAKSLL